MKENVYIAKAKSLDVAVKQAESYFGTTAEHLEIKVIQNPRTFFGISLAPVMIEASLKPEREERVDGSFSICYESEGVLLKLVHPKGDGRPVNEDEIVERIYQKNIQEVDFEQIAAAIAYKKEEAVIAPYQEQIKIDEQAQLTVSPDDMEADLELFPPDGGKLLGYGDLLALLAEHGVVYGRDVPLIKQLTENKVYGKRFGVASGSKPKDGADGRIEYLLDLSASGKPKYLNDGTVDYYEIENYKTVFQGDVLARYHKPAKGVMGYTVKGKELKAYDGKEMRLPIGTQVALAENGTDIIACVDGVAEMKGDKICVSNFLVINGDVDLSVGNINFSGNVKISGNVMSCLSVTASGNVEIDGFVEAATITAAGDIKLKRGVSGGRKAVIKAGGSIYAGFLENTVVQADKNVCASSIIHCEVECGGSIVVSGIKGILYGGKLKALHKISAKIIGSNANVATVLEIGIDPAVREEYEQLKEKIKTLEKELDRMSLAVRKPGETFSKRQEAIYSKLSTERIRKKFQLEGCHKALLEVESKIENETDASVNVLDTIYPGTKIVIKTVPYSLNSQNTYTTYRLNDGAIETMPYSDK